MSSGPSPILHIATFCTVSHRVVWFTTHFLSEFNHRATPLIVWHNVIRAVRIGPSMPFGNVGIFLPTASHGRSRTRTNTRSISSRIQNRCINNFPIVEFKFHFFPLIEFLEMLVEHWSSRRTLSFTCIRHGPFSLHWHLLSILLFTLRDSSLQGHLNRLSGNTALLVERCRRVRLHISCWAVARSRSISLKLNMVEVSSFSLVVGLHVVQVILLWCWVWMTAILIRRFVTTT